MRNRMINQSMVDSRTLARCDIGAALLFTWLLMLVDDEGLMPFDPDFIHRRIFGMRDDVTAEDVSGWLSQLCAQDCTRLYQGDDGDVYLAVTNFYFYQTISRPSQSKCPPPPWNHRPDAEREGGKKVKSRCEKTCGKGCENIDSMSAHGALHAKGKERKGREEELFLKESSSFSSGCRGAAAVKSDRRPARLSRLFSGLGKEES